MNDGGYCTFLTGSNPTRQRVNIDCINEAGNTDIGPICTLDFADDPTAWARCVGPIDPWSVRCTENRFYFRMEETGECRLCADATGGIFPFSINPEDTNLFVEGMPNRNLTGFPHGIYACHRSCGAGDIAHGTGIMGEVYYHDTYTFENAHGNVLSGRRVCAFGCAEGYWRDKDQSCDCVGPGHRSVHGAYDSEIGQFTNIEACPSHPINAVWVGDACTGLFINEPCRWGCEVGRFLVGTNPGTCTECPWAEGVTDLAGQDVRGTTIVGATSINDCRLPAGNYIDTCRGGSFRSWFTISEGNYCPIQ